MGVTAMEVSKTLAAQIVHAVYEVVKTDTNLISPSGHIVGSTDPDLSLIHI